MIIFRFLDFTSSKYFIIGRPVPNIVVEHDITPTF